MFRVKTRKKYKIMKIIITAQTPFFTFVNKYLLRFFFKYENLKEIMTLDKDDLNFIFSEETSGESLLMKGENVVVIGASTKRGHLVVEKNNTAIHVPFQFLQLSSQG